MKILEDRIYRIQFKLSNGLEREIFVIGTRLVGIEGRIRHDKTLPNEIRVSTEEGVLGNVIGYIKGLEEIKDFLPEAYKYLLDVQNKEI